MNAEGFIRWALDEARTVEERYTTELMVELGAGWWNSRNNTGKHVGFGETQRRNRERALNPAYEPRYSETDVRHAAEAWATINTWWFNPGGLDQRPIRDLTAFGFFTHLEQIHLYHCEAADVSVLAQLPNLRVLKFSSGGCEDLSPLAGCIHLRELELGIGVGWRQIATRWPDVSKLEKLVQLEKLSLVGNLHVFAQGTTWPKVRTAVLKCDPLPARSVHELPQLPACEFLTLGGVERLDGIEAFPRLRNLKVETDTRDFAPLAALDKLTCFTCSAFAPLDITPLTRLPKLQVATFNANYKYATTAPKPRDFMAFADAAALRELHAPGCEPVAEEVKTLNSLLPTWDDVLLAETPRVLAPWRFIVAPTAKHPRCAEVAAPEYDGLPDEGLRVSEGRWAGTFMAKSISARLGEADWGKAECDGIRRMFSVTIESFAVMEKGKFPLVIEAIREAFGRLRHDYTVLLMVCLKAPSIEPTPAQIELEKQFQEEQDQAQYELRRQEQKEYLERLHRYELKKQLGEAIKPEDFTPPPPAALPPPPWENEDEEDDDGNTEGDVAVKEKPDPPPSWLDDEHPLADHYRLYAYILPTEIWFLPHHRDLVIYLLGRQPDLDIPDEKKER